MRETPHKDKFQNKEKCGNGEQRISPKMHARINGNASYARCEAENQRDVAQQECAARGGGQILASGDEH